MAKEPELKARDKVVLRMTREGAVENNLTAGTEQRVSKRPEDVELVKPAETAEPSEALSAEEQKKVQMRRQQRQFQAEHAENNDTQPPSETSVTEEKRAENPPQNVPEPLPSETPFKPPTLEQHGVSSHTGTVIAETVVTHKLRKTSAVEAVDADAILTQAAETASAKPVSDDAAPPTKWMQKLERKSEKAHERLDAAREKLPTHKVLKKERVFDEETGNGKTRLHFEDELKKPKGKGKLQFEADKTVRKVGDTLASGIHGKIHEVEQENTAVEAAHKTEIAAETAARHFSHHREKSVNKPYAKVSKLEHKADAADAKLQYERNQQEHPEMKKQNMNKHYQKQNIKKEYAAARNAGSQTAGTATKNTGKKLGEKASDKIKEFFEKNKKVFIWVGVGIALLVLLGAGISSCSMLTSTGSSVIASSYLSEDDAMLGAEAQYCRMEQELQRYLDTYESTHNYDEYHFDLDDIEHDPYVLISILSALHEGEFTLDEVQGTLQMLFEKQYMFNSDLKRIVVRGCDENDKDALRWCIAKPDKRKSRKMTCKPFSELVYKEMGWDTECRYKMLGYRISFEGETLYVFDLLVPEIFHEGQKRKNGTDQKNAQETKSANTRKGFYPDDIVGTFGVPVEEHRLEGKSIPRQQLVSSNLDTPFLVENGKALDENPSLTKPLCGEKLSAAESSSASPIKRDSGAL